MRTEDWTSKGVKDCGGHGHCGNCKKNDQVCLQNCCDGSFLMEDPWKTADKVEDQHKENIRATQCEGQDGVTGTTGTELVDGSGNNFKICAAADGQFEDSPKDVTQKFGGTSSTSTSGTAATSSSSASSSSSSLATTTNNGTEPRRNGLVGGSTGTGSSLEKYSCILSRPCDGNFVLAKGWKVKEKVRDPLPDIELAGEVNWVATIVGGIVVFAIFFALVFFVACHARREGNASRHRLLQHRSGIKTLRKNDKHQRSSRMMTASPVKNDSSGFFGVLSSHRYLLVRVSQCVCSIIPFPIVFALMNYQVSWLARGWIASHVLTLTWCLLRVVRHVRHVRSDPMELATKSKFTTPLCSHALPLGVDLLLLVLLGLSSVTITGVETSNINEIPKMSFRAASAFTYLALLFACVAFFLSYAQWNDANCPDAGVGAALRDYRGGSTSKSSFLLTIMLCLQVGCSLLVFSLVLGTPFYWLFPSAVGLGVGCIVQFFVAMAALCLQRAVSEEAVAKKCPCCGKEKTDKYYFTGFLLFDVASMVLNAVCGLYCGDQLKGPTMWFACFFAFVLFLSYGVTNVLYYLALRGDLPPLELAVGLTVMKGEKSEESEERKEAKDKEEDNNEIPPLPSRAGRVSKTSVAAALPKSMFQNPMKHEGRELKEREEDDAFNGGGGSSRMERKGKKDTSLSSLESTKL